MHFRPTVLFVSTSHPALGDTGNATGLWLEELTTPYYALKDAGFDVTIASVQGKRIPVAPESNDATAARPASVERFLADKEAASALQNSLPVAEAQLDHYVAIFIPGGHGAMWDLPHSAPLATLLGKAHDQGVPIATVCHGAAALLSARDQYGVSIVKGKRVNGFTNEEEAAIGLSALVPFLLETRLAELGGKFESAGLFQPHVVRDGQLISGQNPASSALVAEELMACLEPVT
ncbi:type 1 glutamine amidotransferase domain-containing protein [Duganella sp. HH105]|uniref:type 1 glutamine amidotransferase domain-containing protein n=1 Tax=Duganella sp. HH105 TaxID=1781067 RepID=UPI000877DD2C|nr:type 1 glutamine amidotransferase domain-containing protein [Duganella sp. HH105]OEZ54725.1 molecular chaperone Hsp31 and glyoxalase 3 [Duganella sp. HH105]